jgi:hypothetical protein
MPNYRVRTVVILIMLFIPILYVLIVVNDINFMYIILLYGAITAGALWATNYRTQEMRLKWKCWLITGLIGLLLFDLLQSYLEPDKSFLSSFYFFYPFGMTLVFLFQMLILFITKDLPQDNSTVINKMKKRDLK